MNNFSNIDELLNAQMRIRSHLQWQQMIDAVGNCCVPLPPEPNLPVYAPPISVSNCMMNYYKNYKTDCYWFAEETTMGGHICICRRKHGECNCKECKFYVSTSEADKIIERIENKKEE